MDVLDRYEALHLEATAGPFTVAYDGPSRPIITTGEPGTMLSIGRLDGGTARTYAREDADARMFSTACNTAPLARALAKSVQEMLTALGDDGAVEIGPEHSVLFSARLTNALVDQDAALDAFLSALSEEVK